MDTNNSYEVFGFIADQIFWGVVSWMWYKFMFFRCLPSYTFTESKWILLGLIALSCVVGMIFEMKNDRNDLSVAFNLILAYGVYTILMYIQLRTVLIIVCLSVAGGLSLVNAAFILFRKIKNSKRFLPILWKRVSRVFFSTQRIMCVGMMLIMIVSGGYLLFGAAIVKPAVSAVSGTAANEQTIANNIDVLSRLRVDIWCTLSVQEKLDVLQTAANVEQRYLGLSNELNVGADHLGGGTLGQYVDNTHEIIIDLNSLENDSSWKVLDTLCHEAYHSYQHRLVEIFNSAEERNKGLRIFSSARSYAGEFENYTSGDEDFYEYYAQDCESDAREYAEEAVYDYFTKIHEYLYEKEEQQAPELM